MPYCTSYFKFLFEWFWGFPQQNIDFSRDLSFEGVPTSHLLLINLFTEFHHPYRFYMLHNDIPHILLYILIWLIFRFPTVKTWGSGGYHFVSIANSIFFLVHSCARASLYSGHLFRENEGKVARQAKGNKSFIMTEHSLRYVIIKTIKNHIIYHFRYCWAIQHL